MPAEIKHAAVAGIRSDSVQAKTGKGWGDWFRILDKHGARTLKHKEIAALLHDKLGCPAWWSQMIANGYEQAHGMREKHEMPNGYQVSRSKTLPVSLETLFTTWNDKRKRARWLGPVDLTVRKTTANKSIRILWTDGKTTVEVNFYAKGRSKSQVTVQHNKLPTAKDGERMKAYWGLALERLAGTLKPQIGERPA